MLKSLVYMIKTQWADSHDSTLPPFTPGLRQSVSYHLTMLESLVYMIKAQQENIYDSMLLPSTSSDLR